MGSAMNLTGLWYEVRRVRVGVRVRVRPSRLWKLSLNAGVHRYQLTDINRWDLTCLQSSYWSLPSSSQLSFSSQVFRLGQFCLPLSPELAHTPSIAKFST